MYKTLIVDPQDFSRHALQSLPVWDATETGFVCTQTVSNGLEALELIKIEHFDLVLTEINLPMYDGLQLLKQIQKESHPPLVVFISDIVTFSYARESFIYGVFDYLPKPVNREQILNLFARASAEIKARRKKTQSTSDNDFQSYFSSEKIIWYINGASYAKEAIASFESSLSQLYSDTSQYHAADILAGKLFHQIITGIFDKYDWLINYIPQDFYKQIDYLTLHDSNDFIKYYSRKLCQVYDLVFLLQPKLQDETLLKINLYILRNPEADLKLTTIAQKFYVNSSYLSTQFSRKSNQGYSQLVTNVKMKRAEYLLNYTSIPVTDIAVLLGYKDLNYFSKLFKKQIGKSPSEFIHDEYNYFI